MPAYTLTTPPISVAANKLLVDLFNASGSGKTIELRGIWLFPKLDVAVTGVVAVRADAYRTSAAGTGGTLAVRDNAANASADPGGGAFNRYDDLDDVLPAGITARVAPSGGATISRWLFPMQYMPEETNPAPYITSRVNQLPKIEGDGLRWQIQPGTGLLIRQGTVLSAGSLSIIIFFTV